MRDEKDSLKDITLRMAKPKPEDEPPEQEDSDALTISQMNGHYSTMRPANKILTRRHVIHKDGKVETLQFHHLDAKSVYDRESFTFLFSGAKLWELTVEGRNLWRIYDYISLSRWPYIRVTARDFDEKGEVVTAARIKEIVIRESQSEAGE